MKEAKKIILNSVRKQTEFKIQSQAYNMLSTILFNNTEQEIKKAGVCFSFRVLVKNKFGEVELVYFVSPAELLKEKENDNYPETTNDGFIRFHGSIVETGKNNDPGLKKEKYRLLKPGSIVKIELNETGEGILKKNLSRWLANKKNRSAW